MNEPRGVGRWLWVGVLAAVVTVLKHGYTYGVGDHDEMIPQLLRMLDPDLYPRDWFVVEQGARFTVRTPFLVLLRAASLVAPPPVAVAVLYGVTLVALAVGVYALGRALGGSRPAAALATVGAVGLVPTWTLSGDALVAPMLLPELVAWAIALPALRLAVRGRPGLGGALLGGAAYVQLLVGGLTTGALGLAIVLGALGGTARQRWIGALRLGLSALVVALPMIALVLADRASGPPVPADGYSSFFLIVELRLPHHYLPSQFGAGAWARFGLLAALGGAGLGVLRQRGRPLVAVERIALAIGLWCLAGALGVEVGRSLTVAQLQLFKLTVLLIPLFLLAAADGALALLPDRIRALGDAPFRRPGWAWGSTGLVAVAAVLVLATPPLSPTPPRAVQQEDARTIERWVQSHTPIDALFVVPPSNTSFRTGARRSVAITYKPTSFQEGSTHVWYRRLATVAPAADPPPALGFAFADSLDAAYARNAPTDWQAIADAFGPDYALVDRTLTRAPPTDRPLVEAGRWAVYRMPAPRGGAPRHPF